MGSMGLGHSLEPRVPRWVRGTARPCRGGAGRAGRARQVEVQSTTREGQTNHLPKRDKRDKLPTLLPRACPEPEEGGCRDRHPQAQPAKGCLAEFPQLLVMGTLGRCSRNSGRFPFLPQEHRRTGSGDGHKSRGCYCEEAQRVSRILHQDWGTLPCPSPLMMGARHPGPSPLVKAKGCAMAPSLWPGQKT